MLTETGLEEAQQVAERLCTAISVLTFAHSSGQFHITMSIGVAEVGPTQTLTELLNEADEALYAAKRTGRNRVVLATDLESLPAAVEAGQQDSRA
jgi:diguanylate cyclase (GGDEF)-like protein